MPIDATTPGARADIFVELTSRSGLPLTPGKTSAPGPPLDEDCQAIAERRDDRARMPTTHRPRSQNTQSPSHENSKYAEFLRAYGRLSVPRPLHQLMETRVLTAAAG